MLVVISSIFLFFLPIIWWCIKFYKYEKYLKKFCGPKPIPVAGNLLDFLNTSKTLPALMRYQQKYGGIFKLYLGYTFCIMHSNYKLTEFVLGSNKLIDKSSLYDPFLPWLGTGLLTSSGEKWRTLRKILTPAFHFQVLEQFVDIFNSPGDVLIKKLRNEVGKPSADIYSYISLCALDVICESAMTTKVNAQENSRSEYVQVVIEMSRIAVMKSSSPIMDNRCTYMLTRDYYKEKRALEIIHNYSTSIIKKRRQEFNFNQNSVSIKKQRPAFLNILLQATVNGEPLSDSDIREEVDTFMFEGHDTVTSAMSFAMMCLAHNPSIQDRTYKELENILGDDLNRPTSYRDLQEMKYFEMVIKETLRLYPSVPYFARGLKEDIEFG